MNNLIKFSGIVLLVFFCLPLVFAMSFKFKLDKNVYEPREPIKGVGSFNFSGENEPFNLELKIFLNNRSFNRSVSFNDSFHRFNLSDYFTNLTAPIDAGNYAFNFIVSDGGDFFEDISVIIIPLEIVSYFPNETITEDSTPMEIITNKNAECRYSLNSSLDYSLMTSLEGSELNHLATLDVKEEKEYFFYVECHDFYNLSANKSFSFERIIPLETLEIFDISPEGYITDESPKISFRTSIRAICKYSNEKEDFLLMDGMDLTNNTFHHKELEELNTGSYKYYLECHSKDQSSFNEVSFKIDKEKPSVILHRPRGLIDYNETINFTYTPKDDYNLRSCELYINLSSGWKREKYDSSISNNKLNSFEIKNLNLDYKEYFWKVKCVDRAGNRVESDKLSFIVKRASADTEGSEESYSSFDSDINNTFIEQESESPEKYEDFDESESSGSFITGATISNFRGKVKSFFNPFIFIITILALFLIVGIHKYTKNKIIKVPKQDFSVVKNRNKSFIFPKVQNINEFNQDFVKKDEISPQTTYKQIHPQTNKRLIGNKVNNFDRPDWRKSAVKGNLVNHFHWRIMMTRRRKHISRDRFAKILGESETRIRLIEEGFLPHDYDYLISKIEHYLGINLRK